MCVGQVCMYMCVYVYGWVCICKWGVCVCVCTVCMCVYILMCVRYVVSAQKGPKDLKPPRDIPEAVSRLVGSYPCPCIPGERGLSAHAHAPHTQTLETANSKAKVTKATLPWPLLEGNAA